MSARPPHDRRTAASRARGSAGRSVAQALRTLRGGAHRVSGRRPHRLVVATTLVAFAVAYAGAFLLRFEFRVPPDYVSFLRGTLPWVVLVKLVAFYVLGIYRILWVYVGLKDLYRIARASAVASAALAAVNLLALPHLLVPRSVLVLDGVLTFLAVSGLYAALRSLREAGSATAAEAGEPVLIVGAGDAGEALLRELQRNPHSGAHVVGFLDDDRDKQGRAVRGIPVLGGVEDAARVASRFGVRRAYIAIPSAGGAAIRVIVGRLLAARLALKILPALAKRAGSANAAQLRDVSIEDLLRRAPVALDTGAISAFLRDKVVLVTGAAGSIGSEICRQALEYHTRRLVALDCAETPLHALMLELGDRVHDAVIVPELGDVTDPARVQEVFERHRPQVVLHAAAFKHVPLLETHAREAVRTNVGGTRTVLHAAVESGAEAFILISTDKAVNPTSVMGASKRIAELLVREVNRQSGATKCMAVRFGNVLGSNGSVVPIFRQQIAAGGPVTVTHPDMRRYFMTIPEAVQLVLQASVLGTGGEVFVLDMGEPVAIADLAEDMIRLSGLVPGADVKIEFTGIRPGEKLFEELALDDESVARTIHPKVFRLNAKRDGDDPGVTALATAGCPADELVSLGLRAVADLLGRPAGALAG